MKRLYFVEGWAIPTRVLVVLAMATFLEIATVSVRADAIFTVGFVGVPWAALPGAVAVMLILQYSHRRSFVIHDARAFAYVTLSILAVVFGGLYVVANGLAVVVAIVVAVSVEEAVYRFALPAILAMILMKIGVAKRLALIIAVVVAIGFFAAMPGHVTQLVDVRSWSAFLAFSLLMTHAVWRGRSLFAPIVAHAVYDFATIGMQNGDISSALRVAGAAATLLALVVIAAHPKVRVIDIRDSVSVLGGSAGGSLPSIIDDGELASEAPDGSLR